ncbi:MAG: iron ABC transporter substrate-binding protein [Clostridia bacterium]|nr:iron ABC transporter substrate-binding protein [Clostridia bacterium]
MGIKMKKKINGFLVLIMTVIIIVSSFAGCGKRGLNSDTKDNEESDSKTRIVVDALKREVEIPEKVERVVPLANALRMMCYAQAQDMVVGVEKDEKEKTLIKAYNWVNYDSWKDLPEVGEGGSGGYTPYAEEIIKANPDVIICAYAKDDAEKLQEKTGIPVVSINSGNLFEDDYDESLRIIGEVCNKEERCEEVIDYINAIKVDLDTRTKDIKDEDKPSVYCGAVSFMGGHGIEGTYQNFPPFIAINAKTVYESKDKISQGVVVDSESILEMNPDIIFLDPNNLNLVNENYKNNADFYNSLNAVKKGEVYTMLGYNWYYTNVEIALADCYYAASVVYPQQFSDVDPVQKAKEIFSFMLDSSDYYQQLEKEGFGFGKITIGE